MAIETAKVTVADTATALNTAEETSGLSLHIEVPSGGSTVYIGASDVTTTNYGSSIDAGATLSVNDLDPGDVLYAIVASGTQDVHVLRTGVG